VEKCSPRNLSSYFCFAKILMYCNMVEASNRHLIREHIATMHVHGSTKYDNVSKVLYGTSSESMSSSAALKGVT
jgi:hypothetical protein